MTIIYSALEANIVAALRDGGPDAYGAAAERTISNGEGNPCRCCLQDIPEGAEMLILAHRPFPSLHPYAETGPIFLCGTCEVRSASAEEPPVVASRREFLAKGYTAEDRIRYGTGAITATSDLDRRCEEIFADPEVAYIHLRSAVNNCYICRVDRA